MWWALAAAAIPYVMQEFQGRPDQAQRPPVYVPPDRSQHNSELLNNAFNPHAEIFQRAADTVNENVNHNLAKAGILGSSAGTSMQANVQGTLAAKWLEDQTSRQRMALNEVQTGDMNRAHGMNEFANQQWNYDNAKYNQDNAWNSSQVRGIAGTLGAGADIYGQSQARSQWEANQIAYRDMLGRMGPQPTYGPPPVNSAPGGAPFYGGQLPASNYDYRFTG